MTTYSVRVEVDNLAKVESDFEAFAEKLDIVRQDLLRRLALGVYAELKSRPPRGTPIDTGLARNNWLPGVDTVRTETVGLGDRVNGEATIATAKDFDFLSISNNLPYIKRLNEGWGHKPQSPPRFIDIAVLRILHEMQGLKIDL